MQLRCIRHFSQYEPGATVEVPDGAAFDDFHWEAVTAPSSPPLSPAVPVLMLPADLKEM